MKRLRFILLFLSGLVLIVLWASRPHRAEPEAYAEAMREPGVVITQREGFIIIRPVGKVATTGLLF